MLFQSGSDMFSSKSYTLQGNTHCLEPHGLIYISWDIKEHTTKFWEKYHSDNNTCSYNYDNVWCKETCSINTKQTSVYDTGFLYEFSPGKWDWIGS